MTVSRFVLRVCAVCAEGPEKNKNASSGLKCVNGWNKKFQENQVHHRISDNVIKRINFIINTFLFQNDSEQVCAEGLCCLCWRLWEKQKCLTSGLKFVNGWNKKFQENQLHHHISDTGLKRINFIINTFLFKNDSEQVCAEGSETGAYIVRHPWTLLSITVYKCTRASPAVPLYALRPSYPLGYPMLCAHAFTSGLSLIFQPEENGARYWRWVPWSGRRWKDSN
jgi:hypothetical protein